HNQRCTTGDPISCLPFHKTPPIDFKNGPHKRMSVQIHRFRISGFFFGTTSHGNTNARCVMLPKRRSACQVLFFFLFLPLPSLPSLFLLLLPSLPSSSFLSPVTYAASRDARKNTTPWIFDYASGSTGMATMMIHSGRPASVVEYPG